MPSVWEIFVKVFKKDQPPADTAKKRLQVVLQQDRIKMTPDAKEQIKKDILHTISQYVEIEEETFDIDIQYDGIASALVASMPVKGGRAEISGKKKTVKKTTRKKKTTSKKKSSSAKSKKKSTSGKKTSKKTSNTKKSTKKTSTASKSKKTKNSSRQKKATTD